MTARSGWSRQVRQLVLGLSLLPAGVPTTHAAPPQPPAPAQSCVDVAVGSAQSYACLNQQLGDIARQAPRPSSTDAPYTATSPGNVTGQFNEGATRDRLGSSFGHSVTPQRPAYTPPAAALPRP